MAKAKKKVVPANADEALVKLFSEATLKRMAQGVRRPVIEVPERITAALKAALKREGPLVIEVGRLVDLLGISKSYAAPEGVHLLVQSLNARWKADGIHVGQRTDAKGGKYVTLSLR